MKKMNRFFALTAIMAMCAGQLQAQDCCNADDCGAYCDSGRASYMAALLPIGALVVAAVVIATTDHGHHHSSSSSSCRSHHSHSSSSSCGCGN